MQQHIHKRKKFCVGIKTAFKYLTKSSSEHCRKESKQTIFLGSIDVFQGNLGIDDIESWYRVLGIDYRRTLNKTLTPFYPFGKLFI